MADERYWHPFLTAVEQSDQGRDITDAMNRFMRNVIGEPQPESQSQPAVVEAPPVAQAPTSTVPNAGDEVVQLGVRISVGSMVKVCDAWTAWLDHHCEDSLPILYEFMEAITERFGFYLFGDTRD